MCGRWKTALAGQPYDPDAPWLVAVVVAITALLAAAIWVRDERWLLFVVVLFGLAAAVFDVRELVHQVDVGRASLIALAAVLAVVHLGVSGLAAATVGEGGCGHGLRRSGSGLSCGPSCGAGRPPLQGGRPGPADFPEPPQGHAAPDDLDDPERSPNSDTPRASRARALLHPHRRPHRHEPPQEPPGDRRHGRHRWHAPLGGHARGGGRGGRRATRHGRKPAHGTPTPGRV